MSDVYILFERNDAGAVWDIPGLQEHIMEFLFAQRLAVDVVTLWNPAYTVQTHKVLQRLESS